MNSCVHYHDHYDHCEHDDDHDDHGYDDHDDHDDHDVHGVHDGHDDHDDHDSDHDRYHHHHHHHHHHHDLSLFAHHPNIGAADQTSAFGWSSVCFQFPGAWPGVAGMPSALFRGVAMNTYVVEVDIYIYIIYSRYEDLYSRYKHHICYMFIVVYWGYDVDWLCM